MSLTKLTWQRQKKFADWSQLSDGPSQEYVEDCPVCCRLNVIHVEIDEDGETRVRAAAEQD